MTTPDANALEEAEAARIMMRQFEERGLSLLEPLSPSLTESTVTIPLSSDFSPTIKLIHPKTPSSPRPLIVLFYAGGFKTGTIHQLTEPGRTFASHFNAVVVLGEYRMVPEVRWPVPWRDGWDLLSYLSEHAHQPEFGSAELDPVKGGGFVVGGVSAGASIAAAVAGIDALGLAPRAGVPELKSKLTGVMANVPFLVVPEILPDHCKGIWTAWQDNEDADRFNTEALKGVMENIECTDYTSCWFSPISELSSSEEKLENHPRVYVSVCQLDPLRDDGKVYRKLLEKRGVEVKMDIFPDDEHNGWSVMPLPRNSKSPTIEEAYMEGMRWLLRM